MPFNSSVPITSFPSKAVNHTRVDPKNSQHPAATEVTNKMDQSDSVQAKEISANEAVASPTPTKAIASSSLLRFHHESRDNKRDSLVYPVNKRLSQISTESKGDIHASAYSPRDIKKTIGPWNLGATLGEGATGRVRKARHIGTGQVAAVKIMSKLDAISMRSHSVSRMDTKLATKAHQATRNTLPFGLEREIVIMKLISHPNIIKLFDLWENRGEIYLVLEYVEGGELFKYIVERGHLEERDAFRMFRQIMSAISYCHIFRLCHRDIKPENILVDSIGNIKLADFGMATREHIGGLTTSCGSPHYAPPEIACGEAYIGAQADIWSCGVVLYVMLAGSLPFGSTLAVDDIEGVLEEIANEDPPGHEYISMLVMDLLLGMLDKNPSTRSTANDIWVHPIMKMYGYEAKIAKDRHRWIGGPPKELDEKDCVKVMQRSEIDRDILSGLCTLWHCVDSEEMMMKLMEKNANYEKVVYANLLKFRTEQEENYLGGALEHTDSDVHHVQRRPIRTLSRLSIQGTVNNPLVISSSKSIDQKPHSALSRSKLSYSTTSGDLLGEANQSGADDTRRSSLPPLASPRFTIIAPSHKRIGSESAVTMGAHQASRQPSHKSQSTERSYDPFRASSTVAPATRSDHARVTLLRNASGSSKYNYANYAASQRRPALEHSLNESSLVENSLPSIQPSPMERGRTLRRVGIQRQTSSSSWASTRMSNSSVRQFPVPSIRHKRITQFSSDRRRSPPPARPRNPTPLTMQQRYLRDGYPGSVQIFDVAPIKIVKKQTQPVADEVEVRKEFSLVPPDNTNRTSVLWEERTRQASLELSTLMDEVFSDDKIESALWDSEKEKEKQEEFVRRSFDLPNLRETGYSRPLPDVPLKKPEAPPPSADPPKLRSIYDADSVEELTRVRAMLEVRAKDLGTASLDPVIGHIDRLLQHNPTGRRAVSAPETNRNNDYINTLSPVKEEDELRHVSSPVRGLHKLRSSLFGDNKSTIRLVEDDGGSMFPAPLKIRKKSNGNPLTSLLSPRTRKATDTSTVDGSVSGHPFARPSTPGLERIIGADVDQSSVFVNESSPGVPHVHGLQNNKDVTVDSTKVGRNWFRRSRVSSTSTHGSPLLGSREVYDMRRTVGSSTHVSSEDFMFRLPKREGAAARVLRFFKGQPKQRRMQIAVPDQNDEDWYDTPSKLSNPNHTIRNRNRSRSTVNSLYTGRNNTMTSQSSMIRESHLARMSSPHLYHPPPIQDPYAQSNGPTNLLARMFNIQVRQVAPTPQLICLQLSRALAINEIRSMLKGWRSYGVKHLNTNKRIGTIRATVVEGNALNLQPVIFVATVHAVAVDGNAGGLSIVKITAEWGNRNSFAKTCECINDNLRCRGLVVPSRHVSNEMKTALRDWERI